MKDQIVLVLLLFVVLMCIVNTQPVNMTIGMIHTRENITVEEIVLWDINDTIPVNMYIPINRFI
jgi:hypothetical protein